MSQPTTKGLLARIATAWVWTAVLLCVAMQPARGQASGSFDVDGYLRELRPPSSQALAASLQALPTLAALERRLVEAGAESRGERARQDRAEYDSVCALVAAGSFDAALAAVNDAHSHRVASFGPDDCAATRFAWLREELSGYIDLDNSDRANVARAFALGRGASDSLDAGDGEGGLALARAMLSLVAPLLPPSHPRVADALMWIGLAMGPEGRRVLLESAARMLRVNPRSVASGQVLEHLSRTHYLAGRFAQAERFGVAALDIQLECAGPHSEGAAARLGILAPSLAAQRRVEDGVRLAQRGLDTFRSLFGDEDTRVLTLATNIAAMQVGSGNPEAAVQAAEEALRLASQLLGPDDRGTVRAASNFAAALVSAARFTEAEAVLRPTLATSVAARGNDTPEAAMIRNNLGRVLYRLRELDEAEVHLVRALQHYREHGAEDPHTLANTLDNLAGTLLARGDPDRARPLAEEALELRVQIGGERSAAVALSLYSLGFLCDATDDVDASIRYHRRSLELRREFLPPSHPDVLASLGMLGRVLARAGELEEAGRLYDEAAQYDESLAAVDKSRAADQLQLRAALARTNGDLAGAESLATSALELLIDHLGSEHLKVAGAWTALGNLAVARRDWDQAAEHFARGFEIVDRQRTQVLGAEIERALYADSIGHGALARALANVLTSGDRPGEALEAAERGRGRVLLDLVARSGVLPGDDGQSKTPERVPNSPSAEAALRAQRALPLESDGDAARLSQARADFARARRELFSSDEDALDTLRRLWPAAAPATLEEIRAELLPGELLLSYVWMPESLAIQWIGSAGTGPVRGTVSRQNPAALRERTRAAAEALAHDPRERLAAPNLTHLREGFLPPQVMASVRASQRVIVVGDGPLAALPLETLLWDDEAPPSQEVVYTTSATLFRNRRILARSRAEQRDESASSSAVVVGDPLFGTPSGAATERSTVLKQLPGTRREATAIADLLRASKFHLDLLLGRDAHLPAVRSASQGARVVHLATHGSAGSRAHPYDASLALADAGHGTSSLTLDALVGHWGGRLAATELVVLSACDTQQSVSAGDSRLALPWGFFYAGATSVVATLWKVDDRAATLLMVRFYENLLGRTKEPRSVAGATFTAGSPLPISAALTEAKHWLRSATHTEINARAAALELNESSDIRSTGASPPVEVDAQTLRPYAAPYFWSGFLLNGDPGWQSGKRRR